MAKTSVAAVERLEEKQAELLKRDGWRPVVRWLKQVDRDGDLSTTGVVLTTAEAVESASIAERRRVRRRLRSA